jgi:hypothetical protein
MHELRHLYSKGFLPKNPEGQGQIPLLQGSFCLMFSALGRALTFQTVRLLIGGILDAHLVLALGLTLVVFTFVGAIGHIPNGFF